MKRPDIIQEILDTHEFRVVRLHRAGHWPVVQVQHRPIGGQWEMWSQERDGLAQAEMRVAEIMQRRAQWQPPLPGQTVTVPSGTTTHWTDAEGNEWCICKRNAPQETQP